MTEKNRKITLKSPHQLALGKPLSPQKTTGCSWCQEGADPAKSQGICDTCALKFKRILQSYKWRTYRVSWIMSNPFCEICQKNNQLIPTNQINHLKPWRFWPSLFWDEQHWQPLCHSCHSKETYVAHGSFGRDKKLPE